MIPPVHWLEPSSLSGETTPGTTNKFWWLLLRIPTLNGKSLWVTNRQYNTNYVDEADVRDVQHPRPTDWFTPYVGAGGIGSGAAYGHGIGGKAGSPQAWRGQWPGAYWFSHNFGYGQPSTTNKITTNGGSGSQNGGWSPLPPLAPTTVGTVQHLSAGSVSYQDTSKMMQVFSLNRDMTPKALTALMSVSCAEEIVKLYDENKIDLSHVVGWAKDLGTATKMWVQHECQENALDPWTVAYEVATHHVTPAYMGFLYDKLSEAYSLFASSRVGLEEAWDFVNNEYV